MLKQYKILVNEGKGSENVLVTVPAGAGARGNPTRITAKVDTRYELQDDLKGKGLAPDQVRGKRVGKNLYLMFEDNGKPDVIIEGYYDPINQSQVPTIVGKAENGSFYEYIPHDPELSSMSTTLKDGYTPAMLSLGGGPIAGGAFELAGLPLVAAAAGGGLGGLGWLAAGLGAAALGGGGGGGGGGTATPVKPNGGVAPTVKIVADNNPIDHYLNAAEYQTVSKDTFLTVTATFDKDKVAVGDKVVFTDVNNKAITQTVVLTQAMLDATIGTKVTVTTSDTFKVPTVQRTEVRVSALLQRDTLITLEDIDYIVLDTVSSPIDPTNPATTSKAPIVKILLDENGDHYVNSGELGNPVKSFDVKVTFAGKVYAKDVVKITASDGQPVPDYVVTDADVAAGYVIKPFTFIKPAEDGKTWTVKAVIVDPAKNLSVEGSDYAIVDTKSPVITGVVSLDPSTNTGDVTDNRTDVVQPKLLLTTEENATVAVTLLVGGVAKDYSGTAVLNSAGKYIIPIKDDLPIGLYTPKVTITDQAGNKLILDKADPFIVTKAVAVVDTDNVEFGGGVDGGSANTYKLNTILGHNILSNDYDAYSKTPLTTVQSVKYNGAYVPFGTNFTTKYGTLNIKTNGGYTYTLTKNTAALLPTGTLTDKEEFEYIAVSSDNLISTSEKLIINIHADEHPSSISLVLKPNVAPGGIDNLIETYGGTSPYLPTSSGFLIQLVDSDLGQSILNSASLGLVNGYANSVFSISQYADTSTTHSYEWKYTQGTSNKTDVTVHDLLTVVSDDGGAMLTLEGRSANSGTATSNHYQNYYTATADGLTAKGTDVVGIKDELILYKDGLFLDLTTKHVLSMESFDIRGTGQSGSAANTIKIDLNAVIQSTAIDSGHKALYIIGDSGDKIEIVGVADWTKDLNASTASTYVYYNKNAHEELIIQNAINNITFV